ncbi:HNH endonuclease [Curtobacterium sp. TXMA1]|uniref:HNH endonuclease n=1 Tax=Curtobacterium sp. TXMA1 TaxID=2876939 RepID=UPI001CCE8399|nr:HNH endonuclease [Curtobacterium sp. TXMA1]UBQ03690.1 HNH endonuclease [Curtobacterium sp. TXMA1]
MPLTSHSTLRDRLLTYLTGIGGSSTRAQALDALESLYAGQWTEEDNSPQNTRQFETKWRNRVSFERQRLVERGVLQARSDGIWALADGFDPSRVDLERLSARNVEIHRRENIWLAAKAAGAPDDVPSRELESLHLRAGGRGIYVDVTTTKSAIAPAGVAVSFLDLGQAYANERNVHGVTYRLPRTTRAGRDEAEIAATVRAYELAMPVFVILPGTRRTSRAVRRAVVEGVDLARGSVLITFLDNDPLPPEPEDDENNEFEFIIDDVETRWQRRKARPNQARFAFAVLQRYGARCAVCDLDAEPVVEAAHIRAKALQGSDDARNGLPLCSNHHRMYDAGWYAFEPTTTSVVFRAQRDPGQLQVARSNLSHLPLQPSRKALEDAWERWSTKA